MLVTTFIYKKNALTIGKIGLIFLVIAAITVIPVFLTGEASEESVEKIVQSEQLIEQHEEATKLALFTILGVGIISLVALIMSIRTQMQNRSLVVSVVLFSFISFGFVVRAAQLGGKIRHTEIATSNGFNSSAVSDEDN